LKIIITLGPASSNTRILKSFVRLGVDYFRINLSHTNFEEFKILFQKVRNITNIPILIDTQGPQIRFTKFNQKNIYFTGGQEIELKADQEFSLTPREVFLKLQPNDELSVNYTNVLFKINEVSPLKIKLSVIEGGFVLPGKSLSLKRSIDLPFLSELDRQAIPYSRHIAFSYLSNSNQLKEIDPGLNIISKIETIDALKDIENISANSKALLIDRGDLAWNVSLLRYPLIEESLLSRKFKIPIYLGTNFLESMIFNPYPTIAEINDLHRIVRLGVDGILLAGETAVGKYPLECCKFLKTFFRKYNLSHISKRDFS